MVHAARRKVGVRTFVYLRPGKWVDVFRLLARRSGA
jgi:hypothetical protein